jgi:serine protease Do
MFAHEKKIISIIEKTIPAVVSIEAYKEIADLKKKNPQWIFQLFDQKSLAIDFIRKHERNGIVKFGGGSGFVVDSSGIIVTNTHVIIRDHLDYQITDYKGRRFQAQLIASDQVNDVAFLKISQNIKMPALLLGDSSKIKLGQSVYAIGNVLGIFQNTVSAGIISGLARSISARSEAFSENLRGLIQTDAAINPGSSGGPLIDSMGNVIGINTASVTAAENIGFAIPINIIKKDLEQVKKYGRIIRPFLGVRYIIIDNIVSKLLKLPVDYGAIVLSPFAHHKEAVIKNSPADKAGIKDKDIILQIDDKKLTSDFSIQEFLDDAKVGQKIELKILRKNKELIIPVILGERK